MDVTYKLLKNGHILSPEDKLCIHGIEYCVKTDYGLLFYLENLDYSGNDRIFKVLGIKDKYGYAELFGSRREDDGDFPFFRSLTDLTKCVISLYEEPEFKVGDLVYVLPRLSSEYTPVVYCDAMTRYSESFHVVKHILSRSETMFCDGKDNGDPHSYTLDACGYSWTSQMIRKAIEEEIQKAKREIKDPDYYPIIAQMDGMLKSSQCQPVDFWRIPMYAPVCKDTVEDTEVRLPKNEKSTPHIKL